MSYYGVYTTKGFDEEVDKLEKIEQERINKLFPKLKENPYVGDPLRYKFFREKRIKKLPKISLSPQQATEYSPRNFSLSATSNFSLSKSATASCGVLNPDLEIKELSKNYQKTFIIIYKYHQYQLDMFFLSQPFPQPLLRLDIIQQFATF